VQLQDGVPAAGISGQGVRLVRFSTGGTTYSVRLGGDRTTGGHGNDTFPLKQMFSGTAFIFSSVSLSGR